MAYRAYTEEQIEQMVSQKKTEVEIEWLEAYGSFCNHCIEYYDRSIIITPFEGHYGYAGVVIAINGSPMRGTMLVKSTDIREDVPQAPIMYQYNRCEVQSMYTLHSDDLPRKVDDQRGHLKKSKHTRLWKATVNLLVERGLLFRRERDRDGEI